MRFALYFSVFSLTATFACATPSSIYADGAPMRPVETRPVYTPAGAGLPEYWAEPQPEAKPRSPHKRHLPPTKGAGIWASDEPRMADDPNDGWHPPVRTVGEPVPRIAIADVVIPTAPEARDAVDTLSTEQCAYITRLNLLEAKLGRKIDTQLTKEERTCLIASAMSACQTWLAATWIATIETAHKAGIPLDEDPSERFKYGRLAIALMSKWRESACGEKGADTPRVARYRRALAEAADRLQNQGRGESH